MLFLANCAIAGVIGEVLEEFTITDTKANRDAIAAIQKSIDERDIRDFKSIIDNRVDNAFIVKSEIEKIDAPKFLMFLAMTESKFMNFATSGKKAGGMWQFMPATAKAYGLDINAHVDERRDPYLSTDTAFAYIASLNDMFDDRWYLSLMAYNCGQGCMSRVIKQLGTSNFSTLINSPKTPKETRNFIKKIIKYTLISKKPQINKELKNLEPKLEVEKIKVEGGTQLSTIARSIGLNMEEMKRINPHIKAGKAPEANETYHFYIPQDKLNLYSLNYIGKVIRGEKQPQKSYEIHQVVKNDTLESIANLWKASVSEIKEINSLKGDKIVVGQKLKIPVTKLALGDNKAYTIKNGDTLIGISKKFDVNLKDLVAVNDISGSNIKVGDKIVIP